MSLSTQILELTTEAINADSITADPVTADSTYADSTHADSTNADSVTDDAVTADSVNADSSTELDDDGFPRDQPDLFEGDIELPVSCMEQIRRVFCQVSIMCSFIKRNCLNKEDCIL